MADANAAITFVFSNPAHHAEILLPVARELDHRGHCCRVVSLAEINGLRTPHWNLGRVDLHRAVPPLRRTPSVGAGLDDVAGGRLARGIAHDLVWRVLALRMRWLLWGSDVVVVPSDVAYPYAHLTRALTRRGVPFVLVQEGIRFPLPREQQAAAVYGNGDAAATCCWGPAAAEHFASLGSDGARVRVTGNPRYDSVDPAAWRTAGDELRARLGLTERPLLFLSNPIDDQGFCTTTAKLELFEAFLRAAAPRGLPIVVKLHPREDAEAFRARVQSSGVTVPVHVVTDALLFAVLAMGRAAVVLASTVGLEALLFGLPLGVLAIPGHGHVFEYVARDAAVPLSLGDNFAHALDSLLDGPPPAGAAALVARHLAHRGSAASRVAGVVEEIAERCA